MTTVSLLLFMMLVFIGMMPGMVSACETCSVTWLGKQDTQGQPGEKFYVEYFFEQKNWDAMDAHTVHQLHHEGHHVHDKVTEDIHHFKLGRRFREDMQVFVEMPYVIRRSLEVDAHSILGSKQKSQGMGDLHLIGDYRFWKEKNQSLSVVAGLKFPTGSTREKNTVGARYEVELQPGSGSYDYVLGGIYQVQAGRAAVAANASYVFTSEGAADFEFGDTASVSVYADYLLNPGAKRLRAKAGLDAIFQYEQKQEEAGAKIADSGGSNLLMGPVLKLEANDMLELSGSFLYPVYQKLGGVHQELDFMWTLGSRVGF